MVILAGVAAGQEGVMHALELAQIGEIDPVGVSHEGWREDRAGAGPQVWLLFRRRVDILPLPVSGEGFLGKE